MDPSPTDMAPTPKKKNLKYIAHVIIMVVRMLQHPQDSYRHHHHLHLFSCCDFVFHSARWKSLKSYISPNLKLKFESPQIASIKTPMADAFHVHGDVKTKINK